MYKGQYMIGIYTYDELELCENIMDTANEFAEYLNISLSLARVILSKVFHGVTNYIIVNGRRKKIEFINSKFDE